MLLPQKYFLKTKKRSGTSLPDPFSLRFLKKNISLVTFYDLTKVHCLIAFTLWNIRQYLYCKLFGNQVMMSYILKLTLSFCSSLFFYMTRKSRQKFKYLENGRALFLAWRMVNFAGTQEEIHQNLPEPILFLKNTNYQEMF